MPYIKLCIEREIGICTSKVEWDNVELSAIKQDKEYIFIILKKEA